ncbi:MAG: aminotransferase class V-fold PLP-dependent enzyme [Deltaproteobacteria bacterium]|nr:aminotransferase class V-fold PLP-dependent enzyme [Deltaproteobacteria bacterium]
MIYFNNAATSYPKPDGVAEAVTKSLTDPPTNPYRENVTRESVISSCRERIARLFHFPDPNRVLFCSGSTEALNMAIHGLASKGGHIITTQLEHNAVLRPLHYLETNGVCDVDVLPCRFPGYPSASDFKNTLKKHTCLAVVNHASNVTGARLCLSDIYDICDAHEIPLVIDAAQSAGSLDVDMSGMSRAVLAFTGHKGLLGPKGVGGLLVGDRLNPRVWKSGGTGIRSDLKSMPEMWPVKYEAGTLNQPGIAGLASSVGYILQKGLSFLGNTKEELVRHMVRELGKLDDVTIFSEPPEQNHCGIVCFNVNGWSSEEIGYILNESFDIRVRTGLHCAPLIHRAMGTFPLGAVRASFSCFNTHDEIETFVQALRTITNQH